MRQPSATPILSQMSMTPSRAIPALLKRKKKKMAATGCSVPTAECNNALNQWGLYYMEVRGKYLFFYKLEDTTNSSMSHPYTQTSSSFGMNSSNGQLTGHLSRPMSILGNHGFGGSTSGSSRQSFIDRPFSKVVSLFFFFLKKKSFSFFL